MDEVIKNISIVTEKAKNAPTLPVTGAWGGPSPDGSNLVIHFFIEGAALPNIITVTPDENGIMNPDLGDKISRGDYFREIQATFVMTPHVAEAIGNWLIEKSKIFPK
jgi:hypothetical protein